MTNDNVWRNLLECFTKLADYLFYISVSEEQLQSEVCEPYTNKSDPQD